MGSYKDMFFPDDINELWMRIINFIFIIALGACLQYVFKKQEKA
ncbi:unnamed protein product [marine sediment metagenome]|uniref:Uncharacterized protein n=1 Tax=marine sediment metagenome TaxID=412755 RepID=X1FD79_9ZZZZ